MAKTFLAFVKSNSLPLSEGQDESKVVPTKESWNKFDQNDLTLQKVSALKSTLSDVERKIFWFNVYFQEMDIDFCHKTDICLAPQIWLKVFAMIGGFNVFCLTFKSSVYLCDFNIHHLVHNFSPPQVSLSCKSISKLSFKLFLIRFNPDIPSQEKTELSSHFNALVSEDILWKENVIFREYSNIISINHYTYWHSKLKKVLPLVIHDIIMLCDL